MAKLIDRREFIQKTLQAAAVLGFYPVLSYATTKDLSPGIKGVEKYVSGCMWCQCACSMIVHVKNGKAVHITGNPDDPVTKGKLCIKPYGSLELLSSPHRLTQPLKRSGPKGKNAKFIEISWGKALSEIAEKLQSIKQHHGGEALGIWASGRSAADARKLSKAFAKLYGTPNYEKTGPFCNYSGKPAGISVIGTRHTPWIYSDDDFYGADLYIFAGSNMAATRPVIFSNLKKKKNRGECDFIVIDPRKSQTAKVADLWLPIKPGSDLGLALGLIHFIITHDLIDKDFIKNFTVGFDQLAAEILNGNYNLKWAAGTTGLPKEEIEHLAIRYAKTKKAIIVGNAGLSHHTNAVQTHRAFYLLAAITGHFGEKSMGYCCLNNGGISTGNLPLPEKMVCKPAIELSKNPVGWLESIENPVYPYKLRALISTGSPMTQWPNQSRLRALMEKLELSVYNGLTKNINADYFDYILPAATWIEAGGLAPVSDDSRFVWVPQLVTPPGQAKPDRWWWIELGKLMGWGDIFSEELKDPATLQNLVGTPKGYTVEHFTAKKNNSLRAPIKLVGNQVRERNTLFLDKKFATKSKKIELWTKELATTFATYGLSAVPKFYTDPDIADKNETTIVYDKSRLILSPFQKNRTYTYKVSLVKAAPKQQLPLYLVTGRPSKAIMGHTSHWLKTLNRVSPDQFCIIHRETAQAHGIKNSERIKVFSPYGETEAIAVITYHIRKDTIFVPYSYGEKAPFTAWKSVNFLTNMDARCPISGQIAFKGMRAAIKKIQT